MKSADDYRQLIVAYQNGAAIRLQDIATIEQGAENTRLAAWASKQQAIVLNIQRQPGVNVITTADSIREMLPTLIKSLPKSVDVKVLTDRTTTIRASVSDVQFELLLAIALVVMVIYVFLRNVPATIIPSVAVPLSLVGTFAAMYFLGFSINNLTLMALTIATGFVVDDAIVVIENISRYIEKGKTARRRVERGRRDRLHHHLTDLLAGGGADPAAVHGRHRRPPVPRVRRHAGGGDFDLRRSVADADADDVRTHAQPRVAAQAEPFSAASERFFDRVIAQYGKWLKTVLNHPWLTLGVAVGTLALTVLLYLLIPKGFFPVQDNGIIQGTLEAPQSVSFSNMAERQQQVAAQILKIRRWRA